MQHTKIIISLINMQNINFTENVIKSTINYYFDKNQLVEEKYFDWKRNLLTVERYKFVLSELCPITPTNGSAISHKASYEEWCYSDKIANCYILVSMSIVLQQKHQNIATTFNLESFLEMFRHQSRKVRQAFIKAIINPNILQEAIY